MAYDSIRLEKGMYQTAGRSFTQVLESLDPSEQYQGGPLEGLDAFQRQLKRFDIRVKGAGSDRVEKFFSTMDSAVLFPEFVARAVRSGLEEHNPLPDLLATVTQVDAMDYRSVYTLEEEADLAPSRLAEGASLPAVELRVKEHLVHLQKRGRMLVASYEALRFQKLDLFSVMLRQIGQYIQKAQLTDAVKTILYGDGNEGTESVSYTPGTAPLSGSPGSLDYAQLVEFWSSFAPYEMNTLIAGGTALVQLLKIAEMKDPAAGLNFQATGRLVTPLGAEIVRCDSVPAGSLIGIDRRYNLEMVQAGELMVDYDRLIDRQMERAAVTAIAGFNKIHAASGKVLQIGG